jgi:hypothetical protein
MAGRLGIRISLAVAVALACTPTAPCACPPARTAFLVYGSVVAADGTPAAGSQLRFDASDPYSATECDFAGPVETLDPFPAPITDEAGSFRTQVRSALMPRTRCLRVVAFRGAPGTTDSVRVSGLLVEFRSERDPLDSLGLRLTLP